MIFFVTCILGWDEVVEDMDVRERLALFLVKGIFLYNLKLSYMAKKGLL